MKTAIGLTSYRPKIHTLFHVIKYDVHITSNIAEFSQTSQTEEQLERVACSPASIYKMSLTAHFELFLNCQEILCTITALKS